MEHITLFTDILPEEQERMRVCFKVREKVFQNGETIMEYSSSMKKIGLIQEGRAVLYCCDEDGNEYVIDEMCIRDRNCCILRNGYLRFCRSDRCVYRMDE